MFLSASETHNRQNVNRSVEESLEGLRRVLARAREAGLRCEGVISTSFGCPYEGDVPPERVLSIAAALRDAGAVEIGFGDTTGMANPLQVREFFARASRRARRGRADGALPQHPRAGPRQRAGRAGGRRRLLRVELRRARRLPGAGGRDRQHRHRGPRLDAPRDGHRDRHRPAGAARLLGGRAGGARPPAGQPHAARRARSTGTAERTRAWRR